MNVTFWSDFVFTLKLTRSNQKNCQIPFFQLSWLFQHEIFMCNAVVIITTVTSSLFCNPYHHTSTKADDFIIKAYYGSTWNKCSEPRTVSLSKKGVYTYSSRMFLRLLTYFLIKTLAVGWAKVLRNLQCWGVLLAWAIVWTRACCACSRSGGNGHIFHSSVSPSSFAFSLFFFIFCFSPLSLLFFLPSFTASYYTSHLFTCSRDTVSDGEASVV